MVPPLALLPILFIMLGLGETMEQVQGTLRDLRAERAVDLRARSHQQQAHDVDGRVDLPGCPLPRGVLGPFEPDPGVPGHQEDSAGGGQLTHAGGLDPPDTCALVGLAGLQQARHGRDAGAAVQTNDGDAVPV